MTRKKATLVACILLLTAGGVYFTTTGAYKLLAGYTIYQWNKQTAVENPAGPPVKEETAVNKKQAGKVVYTKRPGVGELMGELYIPKLDRSLPIIHGTNEDELAKGVGHYADSVLPGERDNAVLSGQPFFAVWGKLGKAIS